MRTVRLSWWGSVAALVLLVGMAFPVSQVRAGGADSILRIDEDPRVLAALDSLAALFHTDRHRLGVDAAALESAGSIEGELSLHRYLMREPLRAPRVVTTAAARLDPDTAGEPMLSRALKLLLEVGDYAPPPGSSHPESMIEAPDGSPESRLMDAMDVLFEGTGERFRGRERETFSREGATLPPALLERLPAMLLELRAAVDVRNAVVDASAFGRGGLFGNATRRTRDLLMGALLGVAVAGRDGAAGPPPQIPEGAAATVRIDELVVAGYHLAEVFDAEANDLAVDPRIANASPFQHTWFTPFGRIAVGGVGDDEYRGDYLLVVDLGGNDIYERAGGVTAGDGGVAVLIDVAGDDRYGPADSARVAPGGAVLGIAGVWDLGKGTDLHQSANCGAGLALFGMAWVRDDGGNDVYRHERLAQGSAAFGVGLLLDEGGADSYDLGESPRKTEIGWNPVHGQGYGGARGVAALVDIGGDDRYLAKARDGRPRDVFVSQDRLADAQGAASRVLGEWNSPASDGPGGTGWLVDLRGNDHYHGGYGLGGAEDGGLGVLVDMTGNDTYLTLHGLGTGSTRGMGVHVDAAGDDSTRGGDFGFGFGREGGQGICVDAAGDDFYMWGRGGGGAALGDGSGWFLDLRGTDEYQVLFSPDGPLIWTFLFEPRLSLLAAPGTGLFIDLEGPHVLLKDEYSGIPRGVTGAFRRKQENTPQRERLGVFLGPDR